MFFDRFDGIVASSWPKIVPSWSETGPREPDMAPIWPKMALRGRSMDAPPKANHDWYL